jgi:anti-anti-sigma factor
VVDLWLDDAPLGGAPGVALRGEVDAASAEELQTALDAAVAAGAGVFIVDLTDVAFLDSSGVNVLLRTRALLGRADRELVLVCPPGPLLRVLTLVRLVELVSTFPTREQAAQHLTPTHQPAQAPSSGRR